MIISQTPLRVSFFGGGTDLRDYYELHSGAVTSVTIDKYVYVTVKRRCDDDIVLNYAEREQVRNVCDIQHPIFREALQIAGITKGIEITSVADIPSQGSGLGSSSTFTVGLLNALFAYQGQPKNAHELAELACHIEIDRLGEPIGKQDQYAAAFGGFKQYVFQPDGKVDVESLGLSLEQARMLQRNVLMFYTGITRRASAVLGDQKAKTSGNLDHLHALKELSQQGKGSLANCDIPLIGELLDRNWESKKQLSDKIHNEEINRIYDLGKLAGAYGGKLLGAGGGGFFLFVCPPDKQQAVRKALKDYKELPVAFDAYGSRIILNLNDTSGFLQYQEADALATVG
ncbi:GHMP family kinase ATP-binding protein [Paenibacillus sp. MMS18-CY102]|uniref:GHMP family kinase ATP-binding protein n=1 Tax=Paenibacillus sp. MMS18-CY102 TaxID=2682849 RepID=UPI0013659C21|nr:GHMP kinase [Paenibacillus sp. MMS18-CY102]MWC28108.1 GHMP kinase [Paenibacillus sp. MMS18-CY102]